MEQTFMFDTINSKVRALYEAHPRSPVACYVDSEFAWSPAQENLFGRRIAISNEAGLPEMAKIARALDMERGAAGWDDFPPFQSDRILAGHTDATGYASLSNVPLLIEAMHDAWGDAIWQRDWRLWVAWWWGRPGSPTREQVVAQLETIGVRLDRPSRVWACQDAHFENWDRSAVYGPRDFTH